MSYDAAPYVLVTEYAGQGLVDGFEFNTADDLSHGYVEYLAKEPAHDMKLWEVKEESVVIRVDDTETLDADDAGVKGRKSVRIESAESWTHGLFIGDFGHMPAPACGTWPAFWAYGGDWPNNGEIDIIEGGNLAKTNLMSSHTSDGCLLPPKSEAPYTAKKLTDNCAVDWNNDNIGCGYGVKEEEAKTYGAGFNEVYGGVYAMDWDSEFIKIWYFPRSAIPEDITYGKPNPASWGTPLSVFGGSYCDVDSHYKDMRLVLNINLCGDYAGNLFLEDDTCAAASYGKECKYYVAANPEAYKDSYWDVKSIKVYQKKGYEHTEEPAAEEGAYEEYENAEAYEEHYGYPMPTEAAYDGVDYTVTHHASTDYVTVTVPLEYGGTPQQYPEYKDVDGCAYPAPAKGGELPALYVTTTAIEYMHVCPTDPAKLEPTTYEHSYTMSDCHCGNPNEKPNYGYSAPSMTESVYTCSACGPEGADYVTLAAPYSEPTSYSSMEDEYESSSSYEETYEAEATYETEAAYAAESTYEAAPTYEATASAYASPESTYVVTAGAGKGSAMAGLAVFAAAALLM